jgi:hypothetical protein
MTLGKNFFKIISFHAFIVVFNIRMEHGFCKIIILINNNSEENFISQRFVKENDLIDYSIKYIKEFIDRYTVTIYRKHDLIIYIKDSENQNQTNIKNFLATHMERYDVILE